MEDYEVDHESTCPYCAHSPVHYRSCTNIHCEDGYIEEFFDDVEIEGTGYEVKCEECNGTGVEWWCPNCGKNLSGDKNFFNDEEELPEYEEVLRSLKK